MSYLMIEHVEQSSCIDDPPILSRVFKNFVEIYRDSHEYDTEKLMHSPNPVLGSIKIEKKSFGPSLCRPCARY